jgi:hypothetical protein
MFRCGRSGMKINKKPLGSFHGMEYVGQHRILQVRDYVRGELKIAH